MLVTPRTPGKLVTYTRVVPVDVSTLILFVPLLLPAAASQLSTLATAHKPPAVRRQVTTPYWLSETCARSVGGVDDRTRGRVEGARRPAAEAVVPIRLMCVP